MGNEQIREQGAGECEACEGTGWGGDNGAGIVGNGEYYECDCGTKKLCKAGAHRYDTVGDGVPWCPVCNLEADMTICRMHHQLNTRAPDSERIEELEGRLCRQAEWLADLKAKNAELELELGRIAFAMHYPECWDTAAYPTLYDAVNEAGLGCDPAQCTHNKDTKPATNNGRGN